jgi:uncharacterized membrane protein
MKAATHAERRFTPTTLIICAGLLIWAADFLIVYVVAAIECAKGFAALTIAGLPFVAFVGTALTLLAGIATGLLMRVAIRRLRAAGAGDEAVRFIYFLAASIGGLAAIAIFFNALPAWLLATEC